MDAILLCGPTASGKSDWALALAERWPVEIISVDSTQVYRGFDIGSAKPDKALRERIPHHLLDLRDPQETYSAGEFVADALATIAAVRRRGALPVLVGGTMLYFNALVKGLARLPQADPKIRAAIDARAASLGFHNPKLASVRVAQEHHGLGPAFKFLPHSALGITTGA